MKEKLSYKGKKKAVKNTDFGFAEPSYPKTKYTTAKRLKQLRKTP